MHGHAGQAVSEHHNPDNLTAGQIVNELTANLVPGALVIPAAVLQLVLLQERGYKLVVNS
jgi:hypothetical protein